MNDTPIPGLLKAAGIDALRYPGGFLLRHLQLADRHRGGGRLRGPGHRLRQLHGHGEGGRGAAHRHGELRHRHPGAGRRVGVQCRFGGRRGEVLGGGSVSIGFNGTDTGQGPAPTARYINGTVCTDN
jgi:hypothetical protein